MIVKGNHPLGEIIARKLFGVECVPVSEKRKMINRAIKAAVEYHEAEIERKDEALKNAIYHMENGEVDSRKIGLCYIDVLHGMKKALSTEEVSDE